MNIDLKGVQVVILAGGKGKRMESEEPKALAKLKGKAFLAHILDTVNSLAFPISPVVVVGHKKERIREVFGPDINYAHQEDQLGTGHALMSAKNNAHKDHKTILVISTDQPLVSAQTILNIIKKHRESGAVLSMGTIVLPDFSEWREGLKHFGRIVRDENGQVLKNVEWKDASDEEKEILEVNPAIYAFDADWLWANIDKLKNENAQSEYYLTDLIRIAVEAKKKVETVEIENILEGIQPNTKAELEILEALSV